jgi:hypothetical protein
MSETIASTAKPATDKSASERERRRNPQLRALIDQMLDQVRALNRNATMWTAEERQQAEAELAAIMSRVRGAAGDATSVPDTEPTA